MTTTNTSSTAGFTIIETIVTLIVLSLFLGLFFQSFMAMSSQRLSVARQAMANDIAYANLRKITARLGTITCQTGGFVLLSSTNATDNGATFRKETDDLLGPNRSQSVKAYPTNGCSGTNFTDNPVRVESQVTFNGVTVTHASYIP